MLAVVDNKTKKQCILIVDQDSALSANLEALLLDKADLYVVGVTSPDSATLLEIVRHLQPDTILLEERYFLRLPLNLLIKLLDYPHLQLIVINLETGRAQMYYNQQIRVTGVADLRRFIQGSRVKVSSMPDPLAAYGLIGDYIIASSNEGYHSLTSREPMQSIRVLIVDDHAIVRHAIRRLLMVEPTLHVVGEASDGQEAVYQVEHSLPDLILMDLVMPPEDGVKAIAAIKEDYPQIKVIAMITFLDRPRISEALAAGADGCLLKDGDGEMLLQAIQGVQLGEKFLHPHFACSLSESRPLPGRPGKKTKFYF